MSKKGDITEKAKEMLAEEPTGIRYSVLIRQLQDAFPGESPGSGNFRGAIWNLNVRFPDEIDKPVKGLFRLTRFRDDTSIQTSAPAARAPRSTDVTRESDFYKSFADYLMEDLEECTKAVPLGGNKFGGKWGTPDVIGVSKSRDSDILKLPLEVASVEIKLDTSQLITAFGQACAYKLFSHRSYLVVPQNSPPEDIGKLDSLCTIFGIGLILFDSAQPATPDFRIQVRAARHTPDAFYVNQNLKQVAGELDL